MSKKQNTPLTQQGELSEKDLEKVAGGQEVRKMETIVITGQRPKPADKVVKMETIVVTAQRDKPDIGGTKIAAVDSRIKKN